MQTSSAIYPGSDGYSARKSQAMPFTVLNGLGTHDIAVAAADYIFSEVHDVEPVAAGAEVLRKGNASIADIAATLNMSRGKRGDHLKTRAQHIGAALSTGDLQSVIAQVNNRFVLDTYQHGIDDIMRWCAPAPVKDFKPTHYGDYQINTPGELFEGSEATFATLSHSGEQVRVRSFLSILSVTRQALINNDLALIASGSAKFANAAVKKEKSLAYAVLTGNPNLSDGNPLFGAGNTITGSAGTSITVQNIGAAFAALSRQSDMLGEDSDASARFILAPPELATEAAYSLNQIYGSSPKVEVISTAHLPAGAWYVLADPVQHPVNGRITLDSSSIRIDPFKNSEMGTDGADMRVILDINYLPLSRIGAVKVNQA